MGFRIPWDVFRIPKPGIPDSTSKNFRHSGIRNPDFLTRGNSKLAQISELAGTSRQEHPFFSIRLYFLVSPAGKREWSNDRKCVCGSQASPEQAYKEPYRDSLLSPNVQVLPLKTLNPAFQDVYTSEAMKKISSLLNPKFALESLKSFLLEIGTCYGFFPPLTIFPWSRFRISRFLFYPVDAKMKVIHNKLTNISQTHNWRYIRSDY